MRRLIGKTWLSLGLLGSAGSAMAYQDPANLREFYSCRHFFLMQKAPINPLEAKTSARRICNEDFALAYSPATKSPLYSAQFINKTQSKIQGEKPRPVEFLDDPAIKPFESPKVSDYIGSSWKITQLTNLPGGTTPSSARISNTIALTDQTSQLWRGLSSYVASAAVYSDDTVFEVNGVLFEGKVKKFGISEIWVPSHVYKVIFSSKSNTATAWLIENLEKQKRTDRVPKPIPYAEIVQRLPINFMPALVTSPSER